MPFKNLKEDEMELLSEYRSMALQAKRALKSASKMYAEHFPRLDARDEQTKLGEISLALLAMNDDKITNFVAFS
jgi:hypothetical protein